MTDAPASTTPASTEPTGGTEAPTIESLTAKVEELTSHSRKWEDRAKENKDAAKELADLKRAALTDAEKAEADKAETSQALKDAVERAEKAESALIRRDIAVDLELSKEDVAVLDGVQGDEKTLRALAERLAGRKSPAPKPTPTQGRDTGGTPSAKDAFVDALGELL